MSHRIHVHVLYIYLYSAYILAIHVGKYTSPMDPMGGVLEPNTCYLLQKFRGPWEMEFYDNRSNSSP